MDNKGHVTPEEWAGFCSDGILLAQFESYIHTNGETFNAAMALRYYNPEKLIGKELHWEVSEKGQVVDSGSLAIPDNAFDLVALGDAAITLPESLYINTYRSGNKDEECL